MDGLGVSLSWWDSDEIAMDGLGVSLSWWDSDEIAMRLRWMALECH